MTIDMFDIAEYRRLEALGKVSVSLLGDGSVTVSKTVYDELGNSSLQEIGRVNQAGVIAEAEFLEARAMEYRNFASQVFTGAPTPLKGMTRLDFLWGRFTEQEIIGAYQLSLTSGAVLAFLQAIAISSPDDFGRYVVLQHPLVLAGVPLVLNALEQAGIIAQGQAAIRAAEVLDPNWVKPA